MRVVGSLIILLNESSCNVVVNVLLLKEGGRNIVVIVCRLDCSHLRMLWVEVTLSRNVVVGWYL